MDRLILQMDRMILQMDRMRPRGEGSGSFQGILQQCKIVAGIDACSNAFTVDRTQCIDAFLDSMIFMSLCSKCDSMLF